MMKRRDFLRAAVVTASGTAVGCGDSDVPPGGQGPRRTLQDGAAFFPQSIAAGDPRPDSVILWARVEDAALAGADATVDVEISLTEDFAELLDLGASGTLTAEAAHDHCVKARVVGLAAGTTHYYRFVYENAGGAWASHVGRARTAPAVDADVPVRFAFASCQDFIGRYYNSWAAIAEQELDFFVHLGDYVYETTGDPGFQEQAGTRRVVFDDEAGALQLGSAETPFFAARSLDNYRQLYRTLRGDTALQRAHERAAMVATWDDHEFSDDAHGAVATYFDDAKDETDVDRKKAANQAWYEYMPVDYPDPAFRYDPAVAYPGDLTIYRDLRFGRHLHLVMTDLRTYRADHVIPEGAFPGAVTVTQAELEDVLGELPAAAAPYVDVAAYQDGLYQTALVDAATEGGYPAEAIAGDLSVAWINGVVTSINEGLPEPEQIPLIDPAEVGLAKGIAWYDVGKLSLNASVGSRYFVAKDAFDVLSRYRYLESGGESEQVLGAAQKEWFLSTIEGSDATWKVWGNEYCLVQLAIDLTVQPVPEAFARRYYMNVDAWDGFRNERSALLERLSAVDNVVAITGDIHAFYAGVPSVDGAPAQRIREFVTSGITSKCFRDEVKGQVESDPVLSTVPTAALLADLIDTLLQDKPTQINPGLAFANSAGNGFAIVELDGAQMVVTMHQCSPESVLEDSSSDGATAAKLFKPVRLRAVAGDPELYRDFDGSWKRWDTTTLEWV
jgi:alkaline phosphatase D